MKATIERAVPSNILDIYALAKAAVKEGAYNYPFPNEQQLKSYYFTLLEELANPRELFFIARKGRQYLGFVHATLVQRPWGDSMVMFVKMNYVIGKKRKLGIGKQLADRMLEEGKRLGITKFEFMCNDEMLEFWSKKRGAKKLMNYMVVTHE